MDAKTAQHTPGEWRVDGPKQMSMGGRFHRVINDERYPAAFVPAWDAPRPGEEEAAAEAIANARLIAAAPDLLAACLAVVDCCTSAPPIEIVKRLDAAASLCAAAIAKAQAAR